MRTYAEYLNTMTVKTLHTIAKQGGYKGYSKLRKAELVAFLIERINGWHVIAGDMNRANYATPVKILDVTEVADQPEIVKIMASVAPVTFSDATPVKAPESPVEATVEADAQDSDPSEILFAYRAMRATFRTARGATQVKLAQRLRVLGAQLRSYGYNMRTV